MKMFRARAHLYGDMNEPPQDPRFSAGPHSQVGSPSASRGLDLPPPRGVPLATWLIGGAALVVTLTAGAIFLETPSHPEAELEVEAEAEAPSAPDEPVATAAAKHPLDLSTTLLDAQERARIWHERALLSSIELLVVGGKETRGLIYEFGQPQKEGMLGALLGPARLKLSYEGQQVKSEESRTDEARRALATPNCPLEAAFRVLTAEGTTPEKALVRYLHSPRHNRPVWLMSTAEAQSVWLDASSCARLLR